MPVPVVRRENSTPDPDRLDFQETLMRNPSELSRAELESIAEQIRDILWRDHRTNELDPDKEWNIETIEYVSGVLEDAGLKPGAPAVLQADSGPVAADASAESTSHEPARDDHETSPVAAMRSALDAIIDTIEASGGGIRGEDGLLSPEGDPDWIDLGEAYVLACTAIGRTPLIIETGESEQA